MSRSHEAFWWSLFSAGGVLGALVMPAVVFSTGFLLPTQNPSTAAERYAQLHGTISWWPTRLVLFVVIGLSFFHCAHRIRHTLMDVGLRGRSALLLPVCYGGAMVGTIVAAVVLGRL